MTTSWTGSTGSAMTVVTRSAAALRTGAERIMIRPYTNPEGAGPPCAPRKPEVSVGTPKTRTSPRRGRRRRERVGRGDPALPPQRNQRFRWGPRGFAGDPGSGEEHALCIRPMTARKRPSGRRWPVNVGVIMCGRVLEQRGEPIRRFVDYPGWGTGGNMPFGRCTAPARR